jgi:hypothetical protein
MLSREPKVASMRLKVGKATLTNWSQTTPRKGSFKQSDGGIGGTSDGEEGEDGG